MQELLSKTIGDTLVMYHTDNSGAVQLSLFPVGYAPVAPPAGRDQLSQIAEIRVRGDHASGGFGGGRTMRFGGSAYAFRYKSQQVEDHRIITTLVDSRNYTLTHTLEWFDDRPVFVVRTDFINESNAPVTLDFMTSFILGGLGGYVKGEAVDRLRLHRYRSAWSTEALPVSNSLEELLLEHSWGGGMLLAERFGQVGTMPVRGYHPFIAVEDTATHIFWGAQLAWTGSWQMELVRFRADSLSMDGGLADREFGHWSKTIAPGEHFTSPDAFIACAQGSLDDLCQKLLEIQERRLNVPAVEEDLPVIFNEWCYSWGNPREAELLAAAERLKDTTVKYLVIDAGWYKEDGKNWASTQGDWVYNEGLYPHGLAATAEKIRKLGLIPGIWFEAEVCGHDSHAFKDEVNMHLTMDGVPITSGGRHFLNLQLPEVRKKLEEKVAYFLKDNNLGYIKIDYNETIGIGCDNPDSPGEGLRRQVEGTHWFFRRLREINPELVIENCSSGGHRLEPCMHALSSMSSITDAHMEPEIPVITANLHNLMLPRQAQIWAVLKPEHSDTKLRYILGGGMLGRLCLSGAITKLSDAQWDIVKEALAFYEQIKGIIKHGKSAYFPQVSTSRRHLRGSFALRRLSLDGQSAIVYMFAFDEQPQAITTELPEGDWQIASTFGDGDIQCHGNHCTASALPAFSCRIALLNRR